VPTCEQAESYDAPVRGIEVPERTEDFTADPVELFFDLAYVLAFSQLVGLLVDDHTWAGVGRMALLFGLLWLPWQQLTWAANAVSGNGRAVRLIFLAATAASVPMAASTSTALDEGGPVFAATLAVIMALGFLTQTLGVERGTVLSRSVVRWQTPNVAALAVLVAGAVVDGGGRTVLWLLSLAIVLAAMVAAGRGDWIVRSGHFAERHGLIVIIALGEVIVAIGLPVIQALEAGEGVPGRTVVALAASGVFAALLWWAYFDRPSPALEHRGEVIEGEQDRGRYVRDVYTWAHAPIVAGIILAAAALEEITLHPTEDLALAFRLMFAGGLVLSVVGMAAAIWRAFRKLPRERMLAAGVLVPVLLLAGGLDGVVLLVVVDVVVAATLVAEHVRVER
jgi:low temperature requirement protein LtrA